MNFLAKKVENLPPSGIRKFFDLVISAGPEVVSLGVGEPDFPTPWHIREAVIFALERGFTSYSENAGLLELREEISQNIFKKTKKKFCAKSEILVTNGVSEAVDLAFRATTNSGEKILLPNPGYVMYEPLAKLAGAEIEFYDPRKIFEIEKKSAKAIFLNFPGNPLGNCFSKKEMEFLAKICRAKNWLIFSDEIYAELSFSAPHCSILHFSELHEQIIFFDGLSKSHSMTGFRIGWAAGPKNLISGMTKIHQYSALCAPTPSQIGAIEALRRGENEVEKMKKKFAARRNLCIFELEKLKKFGVKFCKPAGAFYLFVDISAAKMSDVDFCEKLLVDEKLAIVPGSAFGRAGRGHVRITYAENSEKLQIFFNRFSRFWKKNF